MKVLLSPQALTNQREQKIMENISISLSESGRESNVSRVRVDGVVDTLTAGELEEVMSSLLKRDRFKIVIDLAGVDYISSAGWGIFISHIRDVRANGGDIRLANMIPDVYEIFELLEFDNVLQAHESVDEAVDSFGGSSSPGKTGKKKGKVTRQTFIEEVPIVPDTDPDRFLDEDTGFSTDSVEAAICRVVRKDPFSSIGEICRELNSQLDDNQVGWWRVFSVLRRKGLLSKKSRFRYAWGR